MPKWTGTLDTDELKKVVPSKIQASMWVHGWRDGDKVGPGVEMKAPGGHWNRAKTNYWPDGGSGWQPTVELDPPKVQNGVIYLHFSYQSKEHHATFKGHVLAKGVASPASTQPPALISALPVTVTGKLNSTPFAKVQDASQPMNKVFGMNGWVGEPRKSAGVKFTCPVGKFSSGTTQFWPDGSASWKDTAASSKPVFKGGALYLEFEYAGKKYKAKFNFKLT